MSPYYQWLNLKKYRVRFADRHSYTVYDYDLHFAKIRARELHSKCGYVDCDIIEIRRV
jgi:hypothetical protein